VAATADRHAVGVDRTERLAGVLDDRQPEPLERRDVGRQPKMCTGSSALVRALTAAATAAGSIVSVRGSMSTNTGRARS